MHNLSTKTQEQKRALNREFKSKMLNKIVETISTTEIRDLIGFRGGAILHLAYSSPRYTNDLDFIWLNSNDFETKSKIISILSEQKLKVEDYPMEFKIKKCNEEVLRLSYTIRTNESGFNPTFIVESADNTKDKIDLINYNTSKGYIRVEKPEDILIDKIIATMNRFKTRQSIKDTDVFDISFLTNKKRFITNDIIYTKSENYDIERFEVMELLLESSTYIDLNRNKIWNSITEQLDSTHVLNIDKDLVIMHALHVLKYTYNILKNGEQLTLF